MKHKIVIETIIEADNLEEAQEKANSIKLYYPVRMGGDELDPSVINVQPLANLNINTTIAET